jgi:CheY-like chemotaxis protein
MSIFEDAGFAVHAASSGAEAIELIDGGFRDIALLVTDIRLSCPISGWDVARHARKLNPNLPIVYVSGDSGMDWIKEGVASSIFVSKPFRADQMVDAMVSLLNFHAG